MTENKTEEPVRRRGLRALSVYVLLVVGPVLVAVALLTGSSEVGGAASTAKTAAGHPLAQLLLAIAVVVGACKAAGWLAQRLGQPPVIGEIAA
ncbi:MAG TPA: hypothetical protein VFT95_08985, partial [Micromonosporaceae bacterium]|nr:hypothetical protein [Micromonosporaceae bacterium]